MESDDSSLKGFPDTHSPPATTTIPPPSEPAYNLLDRFNRLEALHINFVSAAYQSLASLHAKCDTLEASVSTLSLAVDSKLDALYSTLHKSMSTQHDSL